MLLVWSNRSYAADDPVAYYKELSIAGPTNFLVRFTVQQSLLVNGVPAALAFSIENDKSKAVKLDKPAEYHLQFIRQADNFVAIMSGLPLEMGFQKKAQFSGWGMISNSVWSLTPSCQIQYEVVQTNVLAAMEDPLYGFMEIQTVLNLGIAHQGPLSWSGLTFKGEPLLALVEITGKTAGPTQAGELEGELSVSNGLPVLATYHRVHSDVSTVVHYQYGTNFEVPFPSEIRVERFQKVGTNQFGALEIYLISEARRTVGKEKAVVFDPHYYLEKGNAFSETATPEVRRAASNAILGITGEPVQGSVIGPNSATEYLMSNGVPIAAMKDGEWRYSGPPPKQ
jgi:hypothetical protein